MQEKLAGSTSLSTYVYGALLPPLSGDLTFHCIRSQAPRRSFTVRLQCGDEERLHGSAEPRTCVYEATLTTPLACTEADKAMAQAHLDKVLAFEREVQAEIDAAAVVAGMRKDEL